MSSSGNKKKADQLGMPYGTACNRLRKKVLFSLIVKLDENYCFQCGAEIESEDDLSMEHKLPWLGESNDLFWGVDNIAFSHLSCNSGAARNVKKGMKTHPSSNAYRNGCRCDECREVEKLRRRRQRKEGIKT